MIELELKGFYWPDSIEEAISILKKNKDENIEVIAGGTEINMKHINVDYLVDITELGLNYIKESDEFIKIGSTSNIREIEESEIIQQKPFETLHDAAYKWTENVKHQSTIGGNICEAIPSSDMSAPLIALNSEATIVGPNGERTVKVENIAKGFRQTILNDDEILKEFLIPKYGKHTYSKYKRIVRTEHDITLTGVGIRVDMDGETIENASIGVQCACETPLKVTKTEKILESRKINEKTIKEAMSQIGEECTPRSSLRASKEYRKHLEKTLLKKSLKEIKEEI